MILIKNIKELIGVEYKPTSKLSGGNMSKLNTLTNAFIFIENGILSGFGRMSENKHLGILKNNKGVKQIDATGKMVFPCFCDSHTHIVYAGSRELDFIDKIKGLSYEEIAKRGGGILNSAKKLQGCTEDELVEQALLRLDEIKSYGTGAVEVKSGYGLNPDGEIKILSVIKKLKKLSPLTIKSTFLGAHAIPAEFKSRPEKYIDLIINKMIPAVAEEKLADYIDVFCDKGFFSVKDTERILSAGQKYNLTPKIHANELGHTGGVQVGVKYKALSVDHLEYMGDEEIKCLLKSGTMPTLLPGTSFFLGLPYAPARKMINSGLPIALASDFNPGSSPSGNMQFVISLGCIKYKVTPEEAINAATINSAYAMGVEKELGSIAVGKKANIFI
ncbi:MAG: imidazolonepropionase, partial [Bacteroidales bacterium]|nr:imidazolonepropionase [Bacteroidales bacterium]